LLAGVRQDELERFCAEALDALEQHDAHTGGALVRTLEVFAACGATSQTARVLRTHRNTVLHRVQRIQELVGADIRDPEQRLALHVALRARDLLQGAGPVSVHPAQDTVHSSG
jgi:DNA-binding PucR family transcriptional regulator